MSEIIHEYKFQCYQKVKPIGTKGNLWIVEDSVSKNNFVMRKLPMDSQSVYQVLATIHHANIIEITDFFPYNGFFYIIEEYLEWELLSDAINTKKFSCRHVFSIGKQLFQALLVLHQHGIIHRDIKPENIMVDAHGNVKLIDFDIARLFDADKNGDTTIKGSRDYAPPEQFGFAQSDQRTDIYSLGVTLNEIAVGQLPEDKMCTGKLGVVIRRCIEFDPRRRYQSAAQALKHMSCLEKTSLLVLTAAALSISLLTFAKTLVLPDKLQKEDELQYIEPEIGDNSNNSPAAETLFFSVEDPDRIICGKNTDQYPALLMTENQEYNFTVNLGNNLPVTAAAKKVNEYLSLACALADGSIIEFEFDDVFSDTYQQQGYSNNIDFEKTSPEYEILLDDLDGDGVMDLLVTLAWRCRINTPEPANRYYFTEYSTLWVIYTTENNELACSEPLYFNAYTPKLETDTLLLNYYYYEWYSFQNGTWYWY